MTDAPRLTRGSAGLAAPATTGIVHFGLGAFHRAHQAWYTSEVDSEGAWGIHAFGNRSPVLVDTLAEQGGLFTLLVRDSDADSATIVRSIARTSRGADLAALVGTVAAPETRIATLTITEAGYCIGSDGELDPTADGVAADIRALTELDGSSATEFDRAVGRIALRSTPARIALGALARMRAESGPLTFVPCDNMPDNGRVLRRALDGIAERVGGGFRAWLEESASFVSTSVDRITPAADSSDVAIARSLTGWSDHSPIAAEPFSDWVLSGDFPTGRPDWERAGARFVDDLVPWEQRKLWLLNGAHSLLAYEGLLRGHETVADAIRDTGLRQQVEAYWDEASNSLPREGLDITRYRTELVHRFENTRIEHRLAQIATDGTTKLGLRVAPIALAERRAGRAAEASAAVYAAWLLTVRGRPGLVDSRSEQLSDALRPTGLGAIRSAIALTNDELANEDEFVRLVHEKAVEHIGAPA